MTTDANITAKVTKALSHLESGEIDKVKEILQNLVKRDQKVIPITDEMMAWAKANGIEGGKEEAIKFFERLTIAMHPST